MGVSLAICNITIIINLQQHGQLVTFSFDCCLCANIEIRVLVDTFLKTTCRDHTNPQESLSAFTDPFYLNNRIHSGLFAGRDLSRLLVVEQQVAWKRPHHREQISFADLNPRKCRFFGRALLLLGPVFLLVFLSFSGRITKA